MLEKFIYAKKKSLFLKELEANNVLDESIVFIEDTKEIWNRGTFFDGSYFDPSDIQKSIENIESRITELDNDITGLLDDLVELQNVVNLLNTVEWSVLTDAPYMYIEALEDDTTFKLTNTTHTIQYSKDTINWIDLPPDTYSETLNTGEKVYLRGNCKSKVGTFNVTKKFNVGGQVTSLVYSDLSSVDISQYDSIFEELFSGCRMLELVTSSFLPSTVLSSKCYYEMFSDCFGLKTAPQINAKFVGNYSCSRMFYNCTSLTTVPDLPNAVLGNHCYSEMFANCESLTIAPKLKSELLASYCYEKMFWNCESLTTTPELPAIILENHCYDGMFWNCTSLTTISNISALILAPYCYNAMFKNCTSLTTAPELPVTILSKYCYSEMFYGCSKLATAPELPATVLAAACYYGMFTNCTSLTAAPELPSEWVTANCYLLMFKGCTNLTAAPMLPSTILRSQCYSAMFDGCRNLTTAYDLPITTADSYSCYAMFRGTKLTTAPALPATTLGQYCYQYIFLDCTSLTTAPELPATTLTVACYSAMFKGCTKLTTPPTLPATTLVRYCYNAMFENTGLTTSPELPALSLASNCYDAMFRYCKSLTVAPVLPATTLVSYCYILMFYGCSSLNSITMLATDISATDCLSNWVYGVSPTGTFTKDLDMADLTIGSSGIPEGWGITVNMDITQCVNLIITADDVEGNQTHTNIHYTALVNGIDSTGTAILGVEVSGTVQSEEFPQNTSLTESVTRTISYTYLGVTATTTITLSPLPYIINLNLNDLWQLSSISNPDSSLYDGVYESFSNKGVNNSAATMYVDITGLETFKLYIRSYAESNYDYVMVSQLDKDITKDTPYDSILVKAHTRGKQKSGTSISDYTLVEFTGIDKGEHRITIVYRKDSSGQNGDDKGYVLIPKDQ